MVGAFATLAKRLAPSLLVLEDVDLVAQERTFGPFGSSPVLYELMAQMDGLGDDADVAFVLTTNRPDALEPALAARPGRVDLAVELPLPDGEGRRRLLELYGRGLDLGVKDVDGIVERTNGVTASFIKELLRRAALAAAEADGRRSPTWTSASCSTTCSQRHRRSHACSWAANAPQRLRRLPRRMPGSRARSKTASTASGSKERARTRRIDRAWLLGGRSGRFVHASPRA